MKLTRRMLLSAAGIPMFSVAASAQNATPDVSVEGEQDAVDLLTTAVQAMADLETFHFEIDTTSGTTEIMGVLEIKSIEGDVRRPFDFQTTVTANALFADVEVQAIGVDGSAWIQDPTGVNGSWISLGSEPALLSLVNPDYLFLGAIGVLDNVRIEGDETIDGVPTTVVAGEVDFRQVATWIDGGEAEALLGQLAEDPVEVTIWVREDNLIDSIEFFGAVLASESGSTARLITFSNFNEPVEITPPDV